MKKDTLISSQIDRRTNVFLSYSRKDVQFVLRLAGALEANGFSPVFDNSVRDQVDPDLRLAAQDEWWVALKTMIASCDVMVFVVTPDSAASAVCDDEIAYARTLGKRVIAIKLTDIDFDTAPQRLRSLNVKLDFRSPDPLVFASAIADLTTELNFDIAWHRFGTRLTRLAHQWENDRRPDAQLPRAGLIQDAEAWILRRPADAPLPGALVLDYLNAGRALERSQRDRQRRLIGRAFVKPALAALADGRFDPALRLCAAGAALAEDPGFDLIPELWGPAARAIFSTFAEAALAHKSRVTTARFNREATHIITGAFDGSAILWDAARYQPLSNLAGHASAVWAAAFSNDGANVATASTDSTARIWGVATGDCEHVLHHDDGVLDVAFSFDGKMVATASRDKTVAIWSTSSGAKIARLKHDDVVADLSFHPSDYRLATAGYAHVARIWDASTGACLHRLKGHNEMIHTIEFSPNGALIVTASSDETARIWDARRGRCVFALKGHEHSVSCAAFSPDSRRVATASHDNNARLWDANSGKLLSLLNGHQSPVTRVAFSATGELATTSFDGTARIWTAEGYERALLAGHDKEILFAAFSAAGDRLITASADAHARVWRTRPPLAAARIKTTNDWISWVAFAPAAPLAATASWGGTVELWDITTGAVVAGLRCRKRVNGAAFSHDGASLAAALADGSVAIWDLARRVERARFACHSDEVSAVAFSPDGQAFATASFDCDACVWDTATGRLIARLSGHKGRVWDVQFSADGANILTASEDATARSWDVKAARELVCLDDQTQSVRSACFSPNGSQIATTSFDGSTRIFDRNGRSLACLRPVRSSWLSHAAFHPSRALLACAGHDAVVRVWDLETNQEIACLPTGAIATHVAFSDNGRLLIAGASDGSALIWDISPLTSIFEGRARLIATTLQNGLGMRSFAEAEDLLMSGAPEDVAAALTQQLANTGLA